MIKERPYKIGYKYGKQAFIDLNIHFILKSVEDIRKVIYDLSLNYIPLKEYRSWSSNMVNEYRNGFVDQFVKLYMERDKNVKKA